MRYRKDQISTTIKSDLQIRFAPQDISAHSGLELFRRYFSLIELNSRIRKSFQRFEFSGDYSVTQVILVFIALWLTGGRRLSHIKYLGCDPLVERLCGLNSLPSDRTVSRWLKQFTNDSLQALIELNSGIVTQKMGELGLPRITAELDGTVLSTGDTVAWAARGYNPMNRHAKSYFPLLCHIAQTGHFIRVQNRPGNVHDGKSQALTIMKEVVGQLRQKFPYAILEFRLDSAFFREDIIKYLLSEGIEFAMKVPMWKWLGVKEIIQKRQRWSHPKPRLDYFFKNHQIDSWDIEVPLHFYRMKLSDKPAKGHQLDFFTPDDGVYEHFVLISNKSLQPQNLLDFYNGRCRMEANIAEIKGEFAFDVIPTRHYQGNSAHQQISLLAYNLVRNFQIDTEQVVERKSGCKRTHIFEFQSLKTIRFEIINAAGRILKTSAGKILQITHNAAREKQFENIGKALDHLKAA